MRYLGAPLVVLLGALLAVLVACTGDGGSAGPEGSAVASGPAEPTDPPVPPSPAPPPPPGGTGPPVAGTISLPPVPVGEPAPFTGGLVATVTRVDDVELGAEGPGEVAGPGVAVTVALRNESGGPVDLGGVVVNAAYGDGLPASGSDSPPAAPASGTLPPGEGAEGVYVFGVPAGQAAGLLVEVGWSGSPDVVLVRR